MIRTNTRADTQEMVARAAQARIEHASKQIHRSLACAAAHNPLAAETERDRLVARLRARSRLSADDAVRAAEDIAARADRGAARTAESRAERIWGKEEFVGVSFLERGQVAACAVARIAFPDGSALGTGFMTSDRLLITNNHVIASEADARDLVVEFGYELDSTNTPREVTRFRLDPDAFFVTDDKDDLDYTVVAVGSRVSGSRELRDFGWCALSGAPDKHALGEVANIVQHPQGRFKEVVLRENRLVSRLDKVLHYAADTEPGASGSPVFNNEWQVVALHHWGGPWRQDTDDSGMAVPLDVNEGIRTSAIVSELRGRMQGLAAEKRALLQKVIDLGESREAPRPAPHVESDGPEIDETGQATWRVPIEISIRIPAATPVRARPAVPRIADAAAPVAAAPAPAAAERAPDKNYGGRRGYQPGFIQGHVVPLPRLSKSQAKVAAKNLKAGPGDDPFEVKYHHFSVVMNRARRLAFFTACNIDGKTAKNIDRKTGKVHDYEPGDDSEAVETGAEASERWWSDARLETDAVTAQELYSSQEVPGFKKGSKAWMDRMFQRGHLVRRLDPVWGTDEQALKAEADTFHFTNCTPQVGFFNMGTARKSLPKSGGGLLWRAIEDYVRANAATDDLRVCVFTGPVLGSKDPLWRDHVLAGFRVPLRFWKVVVWAEEGTLRSVAMLADQRPVLEVMPERVSRGEAYADTTAVKDFLVPVTSLEKTTGLDFGAVVRAGDISAPESLGTEGREVTDFNDIFTHARGGDRTKR